MTDIPRPEHPRPQFVRSQWLNLNGTWQFEVDPGDSGLDRGLAERELGQTIIVPFCLESLLSGIGHTDFMPAVWYRRQVRVPAEWTDRRVLLHFQACDYDTTVWANGHEVGRHRGGFSPFTCDLAEVALPGETLTIVVRARDDRHSPKPRGKQSQRFGNYNCFYTRTTGIWQTVWLEAVPHACLRRARITPDVANSMFHVAVPVVGGRPGWAVRATLKANAQTVAEATVAVGMDMVLQLHLPIAEEHRRLWSPTDPHLYDLVFELIDDVGRPVDQVTSYAGLRSVAIDDKAVLINGEPIFQRLVLDQGYYPDGIMTAPSDAALQRDIELAMQAGFNGARLHQKVFEERFLYHADRMGYLVWGEFGDFGCRVDGSPGARQQPDAAYITQWLETLERDYSHPSIIGWCPLNETAQVITDQITALDDVTLGMLLATRAMDTTRPVLDASGYSHRVADSDIYDSHDYQTDPVKFAANHADFAADGRPYSYQSPEGPWSIAYRGQPYFVSEFGGIWWNPDAAEGEYSWGYGDRPKSIDEFYDTFEQLCQTLLNHPRMFGYCYTQLTDVFQEQNGIVTFGRQEKFDMNRLRMVQRQTAAIEQRDS